MLSKINIPGLFITGTDTGVGKTVIAGAIANHFLRKGNRVAVCKIAATGCEHRREGLVSEDAEFLAMCADTPHPLDLIAPVRYAEPLAPAIAAARAKQPLDWSAINRAISIMTKDADVIVVEGVGGLLVPMDEKYLVRDVAKWLGLPTVVVSRPALGTINHTLLTIESLRATKVPIAGIVINRYPTDSPGIAEETNPYAIEQYSKVPVLTIVPDEPLPKAGLPAGIVAAIDRVEWSIVTRASRP